MEQGIKEKMERWKILAEQYLKEDIKVFIKDIDNNWYFADILLVGDITLTIKCFAPEERAGKTFYLEWALISKFDRYREDLE